MPLVASPEVGFVSHPHVYFYVGEGVVQMLLHALAVELDQFPVGCTGLRPHRF
jgi:hypothetical protein